MRNFTFASPAANEGAAARFRASLFTGASALLLVVALLSFVSIAAAKPNDFGGKRDITVMTRNLYIGALLDPVVGATDPVQVPILDPAFPAPEAYGVMVAAGYSDAWTIAHPSEPGYTWGQADDLLNPISTLGERNDYVWFRGARLSVGAVDLVGEDTSDRVPSLINPQNLLWPSDHAGVVARLRLR